MKKRSAKKGKKEQKRERKTIALDLEQKCTHTSPRTGYSVDMKDSDRVFSGHEGDILTFNCCMAQS